MSANAQLATELLGIGAARYGENVKEIQGALFAIRDEAERLARMSSAAVTLGDEQSRHRQSGKKSGLDIGRLLNTVCEIYRPMIERQGNRLVTDIFGELGELGEFGEPGGSVCVYGNADELSEVLINFISNANEHTRNGNILVRAFFEAGVVRVAVADDGDGIDAGVLPGIFERRLRKSVSDSTKKAGGIGLSICREIVEDHKGRIGIESVSGKGTMVFFQLPVMERVLQDER
jgi:two-component system phosphate regulon sensor histidine kinase PhoR